MSSYSSSYNLSKDGGRSRLQAVYATAGAGLAVAALASQAHLANSLNPWLLGGTHMTIVQVLGLLFIGATKGMNFMRLLAYGVTAWAAGANVGTWIHAALQEIGACAGGGWSFIPDLDFMSLLKGDGAALCSMSNALVYQTFLITAMLFGILTLVGFIARPGANYYVAAGLSVLSFVVSLSWLAPLFGLHSLFYTIYVRLGLLLFAAKTVYDSKAIAEQAEQGQGDIINSALATLLNFLHLFIRISTILAKAQKASNKNRNRR